MHEFGGNKGGGGHGQDIHHLLTAHAMERGGGGGGQRACRWEKYLHATVNEVPGIAHDGREINARPSLPKIPKKKQKKTFFEAHDYST